MDMAVTQAPPAEQDGNYLSNKAAWFLVWALSFASMISYVDRQILTLLLGPIKADLKLSDTEVSLLVGLAFVICYAGFGLISGWLTDRYSRKGLVSIGIAFWSIATAACGMANSFANLFVARMAVGVGESTLSPAAMSLITDAFPREKLARAMSVFTGATFIGMGLAMILGGASIKLATWLVEQNAALVGGLAAWQLSFIMIGAVGALVLIPMLMAKEPPRQGIAKADNGQANSGPPFGGFIKANIATFACLWIGYSLHAMSGVGALSWTPTYFIRVFGWSAPQIGIVYGLMVCIVGFIGVMIGPNIHKALAGRGMRDGYVLFPMTCMALGAVVSILAFSVPTAEGALALIALKQLLFSLPMPIMAMSMQIIAPSQLRGRTSAIYHFMGSILAAAVGPVSVAIFTDYLYKDESQVGLSIITNTALLVPLATLFLWLAAKPYRKSLADADAGFARNY